MVAPFFRAIVSIQELKAEGTDTDFFSGDDYFVIPEEFIDSTKAFCLQNLPVLEVKRPGDEEADALRLHVLEIASGVGNGLFGELETRLTENVREVVKSSSASLLAYDDNPERGIKSQKILKETSSSGCISARKPDTTFLLSRDLDESFDALRSACELRDFLLHLRGFFKAQAKGKAADPAVVIEVS